MARSYDGPGSAAIQGLDHAANAVDGAMGAGVRDVVDHYLPW